MNHKTPGKECPAHAARKEDVDDEVLRLIQIHMKAALDMESLIQEINSSVKNQTKYELLEKEVSRLRRELTRINQRKGSLYEDYCRRLITKEEYLQFSKIYAAEISRVKEQLDHTLKEQVKYSKDYHLEDMQEGWGKAVHTYMAKRKLTREMADSFVESIVIHGRYDYEIRLAYDDLFTDLKKLKAEKEAQKE